MVGSSDVLVWWLESYTLEPIFEIYFTSAVCNKGSDYKQKETRSVQMINSSLQPLTNKENQMTSFIVRLEDLLLHHLQRAFKTIDKILILLCIPISHVYLFIATYIDGYA